MQLKTLLESLEDTPKYMSGSDQSLESIGQLDITNLAYDSRKVEPGGLFIAVPGTHTDGRRHVADAARRGAAAALGPALGNGVAGGGARPSIPYIEVGDVLSTLADLSCAFYGFPAQRLCTIGVTGTDGKTTTCNLIHTLLREAGLGSGLMTTANFKSGDREWENTTRQSTLEALEVQQFLRQMLDDGMTHAVIEATSHGLELQRVRGCAFDIGVVTNITHEHLEFHKTLENYRRAKARLFEMLDTGSDKGLGIRPVAILNRDDSSYEVLKPYCSVPILDYGIDMPAAIRAVDVQLGPTGTRFRVLLPGGDDLMQPATPMINRGATRLPSFGQAARRDIQIETRLVGKFNVSNCLAAIATAL